MELSRLRRMVRARWWIILLTSLLGLAGAYVFTNVTNTNIEARWSATGNVEFTVAAGSEEPAAEPTGGGRGGSGGESSGAATALVEAAEAAAQDVNADLIGEGGPGKIVPLANQGILSFVASGASEDAAIAVVEEMRRNFEAVDPTAVDVQGAMTKLEQEAAQLRETLDGFEPPPPVEVAPIPPAVQAQLDVLGSQLGNATGKVGEIEDAIGEELANEEPDQEVLDSLDADLQRIEDRVTDLRKQIDKITPEEPETPEFSLTAQEELVKAAAEARPQDIGTQFIELQAQVEGPTETSVFVEIETEDLTPGPTSPALAGLIGLLGGMMLGVGAIIFMDRVQEAVWTPGDMEKMPVLAEVPQAAGGAAGRRRYRSVRQQGVQSVRSAVLGLYNAEGPSTVGFTGLGATDQGVSDLVFDVAASLGGVGRSVLLIDGNMGGLASYRDRIAGGSKLSDLISHDTDDAALAAKVTSVLDATVEPLPNLHILPGDPRTADAVDTLASKSFRELTRQAQRRYDIVMVVGPSALSPFAYVMTGLVSAYIVVSTVGRTRQQHIHQLAKQFAGGGGRLIGAVLLGIKPRRGWVPTSSVGLPALQPGASVPGGEQVEEEEQGLFDRLGQSLASLAGDDQDQ